MGHGCGLGLMGCRHFCCCGLDCRLSWRRRVNLLKIMLRILPGLRGARPDRPSDLLPPIIMAAMNVYENSSQGTKDTCDKRSKMFPFIFQ